MESIDYLESKPSIFSDNRVSLNFNQKEILFQEKYQFELHKGKAVTFQNFPKNSIKTRKYTGYSFLPKIIYICISRIGNLFIFAIFIISLIENDYWIIFSLLLNIIVYGIVEFLSEVKQKNNSHLINNKCLYNSEKVDPPLKWKDIRVGDIIVLEENNVCPADMIILDSSYIDCKEAICYIDTSQVNGETTYIRKKAIPITQITQQSIYKKKIEFFKRKLTGKLEYQIPNKNPKEFIGFLKLKNDFKVQKINEENFIQRRSVLKSTSWIYGLVIYAGLDSKVLQNTNFPRQKNSIIEKTAHLYYLLSLLFIIFFSIVCTIGFLTKTQQNIEVFSYYDSQWTKLQFLEFLILYSPIAPSSLYLIMDIINFLRKFKIEKKLSRSNIQIIDCHPLGNLGNVDHVFIDKTGTITKCNYKMKMLYFNGKLYNIKKKELESKAANIVKINPLDLLVKKTILHNCSQTSSKTNIKSVVFEDKNNSGSPSQNFFDQFIEVPKYDIFQNTLQNLPTLENKEHNTILKYLSIPQENQLKFGPYIKNTNIGAPSQKKPVFQMSHLKGDELSPRDVRPINFKEQLKRKHLASEDSGNWRSNSQHKSQHKMSEDHSSIKNEHKINLTKTSAFYETFDFLNANNKAENSRKNNSFGSFNKLIMDENEKSKSFVKSTTSEFLLSLQNGDLDSFFEAIILCHSAKNSAPVSESESFRCNRKEEEVLLRFAEKCLFKFEKLHESEESLEYHIKYGKKKSIYPILGIHEFSYEKKSYSIVFKDPIDSDRAILICKGPHSSMRSKVNLDDYQLEELDLLLKEFYTQGLTPILYCKKLLDDNQTKDYLDQLKSLKSSPLNNSEELKKFADYLEKDLSLLCVVGLKDSLSDGIEDLFEIFESLGKKIWIMSGDTRESVLSVAASLDFIKTGSKAYDIELADRDSLVFSIQNHLDDIKENFAQAKPCTESMKRIDSMSGVKKTMRVNAKVSVINFFKSLRRAQSTTHVGISTIMRNKYALINGDSLEIIMKDNYLITHMVFLFSLLRKFLCYNLKPQHKEFLVQLTKTKFLNNPITLAIGNGFNDCLMLQKADFGIELVEKQKWNQAKMMAGDIIIHDLKIIRKLMLIDCRTHVFMQYSCVLFLFYRSYLIVWPLFLFNWHSNFTVSKIYDELYIVIIDLFLCLPNLIIFTLYDEPFQEELMERFPIFYNDSINQQKFAFFNFFLVAPFEGIIESSFIFYITLYCNSELANTDGQYLGYRITTIILMISISLLNNIKLIMMSSIWRLKIIIIFMNIILFTIFLLGFYSFACPIYNCETNNLLNALLDFLSTPHVDILLIGNIIFGLGISHIIHEYIYKQYGGMLYFSLSKKFNFKLMSSQIFSELIKKEFENLPNIADLVRKIFKKNDYIEPSIQTLLNPANNNIEDLDFDKYSLRIYDDTLQKKYNYFRSKYLIPIISKIFFVLVIIFGVYTLVYYITRRDLIALIFRVIIFTTSLIFSIMIFTNKFYENYYLIIKIFVIIVTIAQLVDLSFISNSFGSCYSTCLIIVLLNSNLNLNFIFVSLLNLSNYIGFLINIIIPYTNPDSKIFIESDESSNQKITNFANRNQVSSNSEIVYIIISFSTIVFTLGTVALYLNYKYEKLKRKEFLAATKLQQESSNIQDILSILVPKFVKSRISKGEITMAEVQNEVGILFCDICDFDKMINTEGKRIVQILDQIYRTFDIICLKQGVQKIETVGKTYLACAGISWCEGRVNSNLLKVEKIKRLLNLAMEMLNYTKKQTYGEAFPIKIKIGIHVGKVIAGIIGYHKPQFSLIGDTVNTSSRVCSTGDELSITLSEEAYEKVKGGAIEFEEKIVFNVKGKGDLKTYQVTDKTLLKSPKKSLFRKKVEKILPEIKNRISISKMNSSMKIKDLKSPSNKTSRSTIKKQGSMGKTITFLKNIVINIMKQRKSTLKKSRLSSSMAFPFRKSLSLVKKTNLDHKDITEGVTLLSFRNNYLLTFSDKESQLVKDFKEYLGLSMGSDKKFFFIPLFLIFLTQTFALVGLNGLFDEDSLNILMFLRGGFSFIILFTYYIIHYLNSRWWVKYLLSLFMYYGIIICLLQLHYSAIVEITQIQLLELSFIYLVYNNSCILEFVQVIFNFGVTSVICYGTLIYDEKLEVMNGIYIFIFFLINSIKINLAFKYHVQVFNSLHTIESKKNEQNNIVSQLLPYHIYDKLKHNSSNKIQLTDYLEKVTILFADIANFTKYSSSVNPETVVEMLRNLFTDFDKLCLKHKVFKLYTIGDCYVVLGFTNAKTRNPLQEAKNVIMFGFDMIDVIRNVRASCGNNELDMRIGIHTGDVIGGIIGTDIVRYDIYGRDVLIANKMESNGIAGKVVLSETTKELLELDLDSMKQFQFKKEKDVEIKFVKKSVTSYSIELLEKNDSENIE